MDDLVARLRGEAKPVAGLLEEAADALSEARLRIGALTETLAALVEISDSERPRDLAEVKRILARARQLLATVPAAAPTRRARRAGPPNEDPNVSRIYNEIKNLLRKPP